MRNAPVGPQPTAQQGPEAFQGVDVDLVETVAIFIPGILTLSMIDRFVAIAPLDQAGIDVVLIGIDERTGLDRLFNQGFDGDLLNILEHLNNDLTPSL